VVEQSRSATSWLGSATAVAKIASGVAGWAVGCVLVTAGARGYMCDADPGVFGAVAVLPIWRYPSL